MLHPPVLERDLEEEDLVLPPTEDELPSSDGMPMETERHVLQMTLLLETLRLHWADRQDFYVGGNMFVYFSPDQSRRYDFRGPDVFVALDVPRRERKSWVVWQEEKGPDLVIELISESTAERDKTSKKAIYQNKLRVPEYIWFDPFSAEWAGFTLSGRVYQPMIPDDQDRLVSEALGLALVRWDGPYEGIDARWLRWATLDGQVLPTPQERAEQETQRANQLEQLLARYRERFGELNNP